MPANSKTETLVGETRDMRIMSRLLTEQHGVTLAEFIAYRRAPGDSWLSWDDLGKAIGGATGEQVTHETARRWAIRYGIPVSTLPGDAPELRDWYDRQLQDYVGLRLKDVIMKGETGPRP